jgi:peptidyl-prolyl cis-trans isomerase D
LPSLRFRLTRVRLGAEEQDMAKKPRGKTNVGVYLILGLLVFALGGFGIGNFGGSVRSIGGVGNTEVPVSDYGLALQAELRARQAETGRSISLATPEGQALADGVRRQLLGSAAVENETRRLGVSVGDEAVRRQVLASDAFRGPDGQFSRDIYARALRQGGLSEDQYEANVRTETASHLTLAAVLSGVEAKDTAVSAIAAYAGERRDILWLRLDAADLTEPLPAPPEEDLLALYEANPDAYTAPERRRLSYAALTPEMMVREIEVDEAALRALYAERAAEYDRPERRLVERLVFPDMAAAEAARAALAETTTFEGLVSGRGLTLQDVDLGDVTRAELGTAGDVVFALDGPGVVGPVETPLGPALFRVNAVLQAESTPFEEVRDVLADELAIDRARRQILDLQGEIDDLIAGGASVEELAAGTPMQLGTSELGPDTSDGLAAYPAFRSAAAAAEPDDFPELIELEDGGLAVLRLDELLPPALLPYEDVRDRVAQDWAAAALRERLTVRAEALATVLAAGGDLAAEGFAPETRTDIGRDEFLQGAPRGLVAAAFGLALGAASVVPAEDSVHLVQVTGITPENPEDVESQAIRGMVAQGLSRSLSQDMVDLFVRALQTEAGITLNQTAINAVHSQFP